MSRPNEVNEGLGLSKRFERLFCWESQDISLNLSGSESLSCLDSAKKKSTSRRRCILKHLSCGLASPSGLFSCSDSLSLSNDVLQPISSDVAKFQNSSSPMHEKCKATKSSVYLNLQDASSVPLPEIAAHFDESPWIWRTTDTSPLKLSDMQLPVDTPESIKRQRNTYTRSSEDSRTASDSTDTRQVKSSSDAGSDFSSLTQQGIPTATNVATVPKDDDETRKNHDISQDDQGDKTRRPEYSSRKYLLDVETRGFEDSSHCVPHSQQDVEASIPHEFEHDVFQRKFQMGGNSPVFLDTNHTTRFNTWRPALGLIDFQETDSVTLTYTHTERMSMVSVNSDLANSMISSGISPKDNILTHRKKISSMSQTRRLDRLRVDPNSSDEKFPLLNRYGEKEKVPREQHLAVESRSSHSSSSQTDSLESYGRFGSDGRHDAPSMSLGGSTVMNERTRRETVKCSPQYRDNEHKESQESVFSETPDRKSLRNGGLCDSESGFYLETNRVVLKPLSEKASTQESIVFQDRPTMRPSNVVHDSEVSNSVCSTSSRLASQVARWRRLCQETIRRAQSHKSQILHSTHRDTEGGNSVQSRGTVYVTPSSFEESGEERTERSSSQHEGEVKSTVHKVSCLSDSFTRSPSEQTSAVQEGLGQWGAAAISSRRHLGPPTSVLTTPQTMSGVSEHSSFVPATEYNRLMTQTYYVSGSSVESSSGLGTRGSGYSTNEQMRYGCVRSSSFQRHGLREPSFSVNQCSSPTPLHKGGDPVKRDESVTQDRCYPEVSCQTLKTTSTFLHQEPKYTKSNLPGRTALRRISEMSETYLTNESHLMKSTTADGTSVPPSTTSFSHGTSDLTSLKSGTVDLPNLSFRQASVSLRSNQPYLVISSTPGVSDTLTLDTCSRFFSNPSFYSGDIEETGPSSYFTAFTSSDTRSLFLPQKTGVRHAGSCLFFQGPTPTSWREDKAPLGSTVHTALGVLNISENRRMNGLSMSPSVNGSKDSKFSLASKEDDMECPTFVTPYPVRSLPFSDGVETRALMEKTQKNDVPLCTTQRVITSIASQSVDHATAPTTGTLPYFHLKKKANYRISFQKFRVKTQSFLSFKESRLHCRKRRKNSHRMNNKISKETGSQGVKRKQVRLKKKKKIQIPRLSYARKSVNHLSDLMWGKKTIVSQRAGKRKKNLKNEETLDCSLSTLWVHLNRQLRDNGVSKEGIPVLDEDVSRVYSDLLSRQWIRHSSSEATCQALKVRHQGVRLSSRDSSDVTDGFGSLTSRSDGCSVLQKRLWKKKQGNATKDLMGHPKTHPMEDHMSSDALAVLFSNIDIVKVMKLWSHTLNELQKYQRYCSELYEFEDAHARVFQKNDALEKENNELKEKVRSLERLLQRSTESEWTCWETEMDHYRLKLRITHLMKLFNEESQRLKIVAMQKRQSDQQLHTFKEKVKELVKKEENVRVKAKRMLDKLKKYPLKPPLPLGKVNSQAFLPDLKSNFLGKRGVQFMAAKSTNSFSTDVPKRSTLTMRERSDLVINQTVLALVWYYEDQIRLLKQGKNVPRQNLLLPEHLSLDEEEEAPGEDKTQLGSFHLLDRRKENPKKKTNKPTGSLPIRATTHNETVEAMCMVAHDTRKKGRGESEVPVRSNKRGHEEEPSPRWIIHDLHLQLKNTIEEKAKKELLYEQEIQQLKMALDEAKSTTMFEGKEAEEKEEELENACSLIRGNQPLSLDTRELMQRDRLLFKCGLVQKLDALQRTGSLLPLVSQACRVLELQEPRRLVTVLSHLVATVKEATLQQQLLKNVASILGQEGLYTQHRYDEMERILLKWCQTLANLESIVLVKQRFLTLLDYIRNNQVSAHTLLKSLQSAIADVSLDACRDDDKAMQRVLSVALSSMEKELNVNDTPNKQHQISPNDSNSGKHHLSQEVKQVENKETSVVSETLDPLFKSTVNHFMNSFGIPSLNLCQAAIDRLHLKLGEHIRFYRGVLSVLNANQDTTPAQILQQIAQMSNRAALLKEQLQHQILEDIMKQSTVCLSTEKLKDIFKVFRAIQIRLNLPDPPTSSLGDLFRLSGDEGIVQNLSSRDQRHTSGSPTSPTELENDDGGTGLLSCSSSILSSSSQNSQEKKQWKNWAKMCLFTVDLLARVAERNCFTGLLNQSHSTENPAKKDEHTTQRPHH